MGGREDVESGVYFGWAGLDLKGSGDEVGSILGRQEKLANCKGEEDQDLLEDAPDGNVFPMVMSIE